MSEDPLWNKLAGAAYRAGQQGNWKVAAELSGAARQAWLNHCEAVNAQQEGKRRAGEHQRAIDDWEYEQELHRTRGR